MKKLHSLISFIIIIFLSSILVFAVTRIMPLSPEKMLLSSYNLPQTEENITALKIKWGLDAPLYQQYFSWISGVLKGDWGNSLISGLPIKEELLKRLPFSLALGLGSLLLSSIFAFWLAYYAAIKGGFFELLSRGLSLLSQSVPIFISSLIVILYLGVKLKIINFYTGNPWVSTIIGIILLAIWSCGGLSRVAKKHFMELKEQTYIKRLISNGLNYEKIMLVHGYKPVLYSLSGALVSRFASILGGSSVVEFAFTIPGINFFLIESIKNRDYYVIQSYLLIVMIWMAIVNLAFNQLKIRLNRGQNQ